MRISIGATLFAATIAASFLFCDASMTFAFGLQSTDRNRPLTK